MTNPSLMRERLLDLRSEYTRRMRALDRDLHHKEHAVEKDFAEQATQMENQQVLEALDEEAKSQIRLINSALRRIDEGCYGVCSRCGEQISTSRLEAVPYATLCIRCAETT